MTPPSTAKEIKDSFIRLSKKYHPDLHPEGQSKEETEHFQLVVEAYEVLGDAARKKEYDASLGLSRRLPFRRSKVSTESEYDEAGKSRCLNFSFLFLGACLFINNSYLSCLNAN